MIPEWKHLSAHELAIEIGKLFVEQSSLDFKRGFESAKRIITSKLKCDCCCHEPVPKGWNALKCCPDCGASIIEGITD